MKIKASHRGKGFGRQALDFILSVFFHEWDGLVMTDAARRGNRVGRAALPAYGFTEKGNRDGDYFLVLDRADWERLKPT